MRWKYHVPGSKDRPVGVTGNEEGLNNTQAVVLHLLDELPPTKYYIYSDNPSTSLGLLEVLLSHDYAAIGTSRVESRVVEELGTTKAKDKGEIGIE